MKHWQDILGTAALVAVLGLALAWDAPATASAPAAGAPGGKPAGASHAFVIRGARVFDGQADLGVRDVLVRDGRIAAVAPSLQVASPVDEVDGRGKTLLPALIDAHVHAWGEAQRDMLRFGVGTGLDLHGMNERLAGHRAQREDGGNGSLADLWAAGFAMTVARGHGTQYGMVGKLVEDDSDIDALVADHLAAGADVVKLIIEDLSAYQTAQRLPTLDAAQVAAITTATHARGRLALAHVSRHDSARIAVDAGVDGLVHGFADEAIDPALVARMAARNVFVVPTLTVMASAHTRGEGEVFSNDPRISPWLTAEQRSTLTATFGGDRPERLARAMDLVKTLHAAGVEILAGSDAPNPGTAHGASLHHELELLVRAGLDEADALRAATSVPARLLGMADRGRIAEGLRADLLLVDGNPLQSITDTRAISAVWKNGQRVERDAVPAAQAGAATAQAVLSGPLRLGDFELPGDAVQVAAGSWGTTSDAMAGGASKAVQRVAAGGAQGSAGALLVSGEVVEGFPFPWAGTMYFPGAEAMAPVDATALTELVFQVRGEPRTLNVMLFSGASVQGIPVIRPFKVEREWRQVRIRLADFPGADLGRLRALAFTAGLPYGTFEFSIDQVELR